MLTGPSNAPEFTLAEISGAVSRITGLPTEHAEVARYSGNLLGLMNSNPALRMAGPNSPAIADYIRQYIPAELAEKADPTRRAELDNRESSSATAAATTATTAWLARMQGGRDWAGNGFGGGDGKTNAAGAAAGARTANYQDIAYNSPQSLQNISNINYRSTPFAQTGMNFSTFDYLRSYDRSFTGQNILHAAQDARTNGFDPNNKPVAKAFAILDKDDGARRAERNHLLDNFRQRLDSDEEFQNLKAARDKAEKPEERAKIEQKLMERGRQISKDVGYHGHIETAPTKRAKDAGKLIERETIKQRMERNIPKLDPGAKDVIEHYRRNPTDAAARHNYDALRDKAKQDPRQKLAMLQIERDMRKDATLKRDTAAAVEKKEDRNDEKTVRNDEKTARNVDKEVRLTEKKSEGATLDDEWTAMASASKKPEDRKPEERKPTSEDKTPSRPGSKPDEKGKPKETDKNKKTAAKNSSPKPA